MTITYIGDCDVRWVYERRIEAPSSLKCVRLSGPRASFPRWLEDEVRDVLDLTLNYYKICWWNSDLGFQYKYKRETNKILNVECISLSNREVKRLSNLLVNHKATSHKYVSIKIRKFTTSQIFMPNYLTLIFKTK